MPVGRAGTAVDSAAPDRHLEAVADCAVEACPLIASVGVALVDVDVASSGGISVRYPLAAGNHALAVGKAPVCLDQRIGSVAEGAVRNVADARDVVCFTDPRKVLDLVTAVSRVERMRSEWPPASTIRAGDFVASARIPVGRVERYALVVAGSGAALVVAVNVAIASIAIGRHVGVLAGRSGDNVVPVDTFGTGRKCVSSVYSLSS